MAVPLHREQVADGHAAQFRDPAHVVAGQVHEHDVFGPLLRVGEQLGRQGRVLVRGGPAAPGAGQPRRPDIILADYHLDGENGLEVVARLRERFGAAVPAVLVTADRSTEVRQAAEELDIHVLNKPVKPAALRSLITRLGRSAVLAAE